MDVTDRIRLEDVDTRVHVQVDGVTVADSARGVVLLERGLPPRYYLPREDVVLTMLEPSSTTTTCPYKGEASYYSVRVADHVVPDAAWVYESPYPLVAKIAGMLSFYPDKVEYSVDGRRQEH